MDGMTWAQYGEDLEANLQPVAVDAPDSTSNFLNDPNLRGWYLTLTNGFEKVNTTALVIDQYVIFSTFAPSDVVVVGESGVHGVDDGRRLRAAGCDAILVGESLVRSEDPSALLGALAELS